MCGSGWETLPIGEWNMGKRKVERRITVDEKVWAERKLGGLGTERMEQN